MVIVPNNYLGCPRPAQATSTTLQQAADEGSTGAGHFGSWERAVEAHLRRTWLLRSLSFDDVMFWPPESPVSGTKCSISRKAVQTRSTNCTTPHDACVTWRFVLMVNEHSHGCSSSGVSSRPKAGLDFYAVTAG